MPINAHPEYIAAEKEYIAAKTPEEKLKALEKMISVAPGHKGAEKLRAELKTRYKKLKEKTRERKIKQECRKKRSEKGRTPSCDHRIHKHRKSYIVTSFDKCYSRNWRLPL